MLVHWPPLRQRTFVQSEKKCIIIGISYIAGRRNLDTFLTSMFSIAAVILELLIALMITKARTITKTHLCEGKIQMGEDNIPNSQS